MRWLLHENVRVLRNSIITLFKLLNLCYRCLRVALSLFLIPKCLNVTGKNACFNSRLSWTQICLNELDKWASMHFIFIQKIHCWCKSRDNSILLWPRVLLKTTKMAAWEAKLPPFGHVVVTNLAWWLWGREWARIELWEVVRRNWSLSGIRVQSERVFLIARIMM